MGTVRRVTSQALSSGPGDVCKGTGCCSFLIQSAPQTSGRMPQAEMGHSCLGDYILKMLGMNEGVQVFWLLVSHTLGGNVLPLGTHRLSWVCHCGCCIIFPVKATGFWGGTLPWLSTLLAAVDVVEFVVEPGKKTIDTGNDKSARLTQSAEQSWVWRMLVGFMKRQNLT